MTRSVRTTTGLATLLTAGLLLLAAGAGCASSDPTPAEGAPPASTAAPAPDGAPATPAPVAAAPAEGARVLTLSVEGMTCGSCEQAITTTLAALDGVSAPSADHTSGTVRATVAPGGPTPEQLAAAIDKLGYTTRSWSFDDTP